MTNFATRNIIDLDAHLIEAAKVYMLKTYNEDIKDVRSDYSEARFETQINYQLDQFNPTEEMDTIDQLEQNNKTSLVQQMQIRRSEEVTNSYTWSSEHGFSVGVAVSAKIKVPFVGGIDTSVETSYSFKKSESQTEETTRSWDFTQTVNVAPYTNVIALLMLQKTTPRLPYTLKCTITGGMLYHYDRYKNGVHLGASSLYEYVNNLLNLKPLPQFSTSGSTAYFETSGVFTARQGIKALIDLKETPLAQSERAPKHWTIDVTPGARPFTAVIEPIG